MDVSSSMRGTKWTNVCEFVDRLMGSLQGEDLVSALVFNEQVRLLEGVPEEDRLFMEESEINPEESEC